MGSTVCCFSSLKLHKAVANHTKLPEILMSNMAALTQISSRYRQQLLLTTYITNWGRNMVQVDIRLSLV
jgi:hypothetical protein